MTTLVYAVRLWPKRRYAAHVCITFCIVQRLSQYHIQEVILVELAAFCGQAFIIRLILIGLNSG